MPSIIPLDDLLGAIFIGIIFSTVIYGITCLQVYLYFTEHSAKDPRILKIYVAVLFMLDTLHVALLGHVYYSYTVTNFGDYNQLQQTTWSLLAQVAVGSVLSCAVQMFYVRRVFNLGGRKVIIPAAITLIALARFSTTIVYIVEGFSIHVFSKVNLVRAWAVTSLSLDIVCDALITVAMIYYLWSSKTVFTKTNRMINMLITYVLNTCLLTTMCAAASLGLFAAKPRLLLYAPFYFVLVRLYSCSLMSTLNSRNHVRERGIVSSHPMITISGFGSDATAGDSVHHESSARFPSRTSTSAPYDAPAFDLERKTVEAV